MRLLPSLQKRKGERPYESNDMHQLWSPVVFELQGIDTPIPQNHEVRIKIHAASVGPADCTFRKGLNVSAVSSINYI
jgi:NADPH:quinone reductase-like Zn-dependent oxidoreductase